MLGKRISLVANVDILYEDRIILVANKPAGIPSTPPLKGGPNFEQQVAQFLGQRQKDKPYLVLHHRLDQDTSGALLFCKKKSFNKAIADLFSEKKIEKTYLALSQRHESGRDKDDAFLGQLQIRNKPLKRATRPAAHKNNNKAMTWIEETDKEDPQGESAETHFNGLVWNKTHALFLARPITGRTHQIRVHARGLGFPLIDDPLYNGAADSNLGEFKGNLHAWKLSFPHPESGKPLTITAPLPAPLCEQIQGLFLGQEKELLGPWKHDLRQQLALV